MQWLFSLRLFKHPLWDQYILSSSPVSFHEPRWILWCVGQSGAATLKGFFAVDSFRYHLLCTLPICSHVLIYQQVICLTKELRAWHELLCYLTSVFNVSSRAVNDQVSQGLLETTVLYRIFLYPRCFQFNIPRESQFRILVEWSHAVVVSKTKHSKTKTEARSTQNSKTKHPRLENEAPKTRKRSTQDRKRSTQNSRTKHPKLENEAPKTLDTGPPFINTRPM